MLVPEIRAAVRTGDTLMQERRAMLRRPPHILVTTPESLYILLTAEKSREMLRHVETVIVDEIHAVADDKRGAHLALSLERLEALLERPPVRIGLSATQKPIERVAQFLAGKRAACTRRDRRRAPPSHGYCRGSARSELSAVASNEMWGEIYDRLVALAGEHRSTLVFVNTRRLAERVAHHLAERIGKDAVAAHHGSLARKLRLAAERGSRPVNCSVLVATASLELGIDIGHVDLVCQIGSPRAIARGACSASDAPGTGAGRAQGPPLCHHVRRIARMRCAGARDSHAANSTNCVIPEAPLDILAQQIVAAVLRPRNGRRTSFSRWCAARIPTGILPRGDFEAVHRECSPTGISARRGRYGAYLFRDRVNHRLRGRRGSRLAAITSGGAIPENALYTVVAEPEGAVVGTVDEDFAVESLRRRHHAAGQYVVEDSPRRARPRAGGRRAGRAAERAVLARRGAGAHRRTVRAVAELREQIGDVDCGNSDRPRIAIRGPAQRRSSGCKQECGLDDAGAEQAVEYILRGAPCWARCLRKDE